MCGVVYRDEALRVSADIFELPPRENLGSAYMLLKALSVLNVIRMHALRSLRLGLHAVQWDAAIEAA